MLLPVLSSILGTLAFLPYNPYPVSFVFLVPLFIFFLKENKLWRLILGAAIFRLFFLLGTVYFTLEPILWTETILIFLGLPVSIWLIKKLSANSLLLFTFLPFLWTFFDHLEAYYSLTPTYIATAGNALGSSPFAGLANFGGLIILSFFVALINALIAFVIFNYSHKKDFTFARYNFFIIAFTAILLLFAWQISRYELNKNSADYASLPNVIKFAAISTTDEFDFNQFSSLENDLIGQKNDFIIFPENIFDHISNPAADSNASTIFFQNLAKKSDSSLLAVFDTFQGENSLKYNSAILFNNQGNIEGIHNKNRLMFIGEYWPFGNWYPSFFDWLKEKDPKIEDYAIFDAKKAYQYGERNLLTLELQKNSLSFVSAICSEIHYPNDLEKYKEEGAHLIINQSSNRWVDIGLNHYLYMTENLKKIESIWLGIPIISSGVDDHAGIILPGGQKHMLEYEKGDKNYGIFFGEIRY
jgi:apolipoprotein N-acyltransferase